MTIGIRSVSIISSKNSVVEKKKITTLSVTTIFRFTTSVKIIVQERRLRVSHPEMTRSGKVETT